MTRQNDKPDYDPIKAAEYNREYWEKNSDTILTRRRKLYANNEALREYHRKKSREAWERKKKRNKEKKVTKQDVYASRPGKVIVVCYPDGRRMRTRAYTMQQFAKRVEISVTTVRNWLRQGVLPEPTFKSKGGHRWFSEEEVQVTIKAIANNRARCEEAGGLPWKITPEFIDELAHAFAAFEGGKIIQR